MSKVAVELFTTGPTATLLGNDWTGYDSTKHTIGNAVYQGVDTWTGVQNFIGPQPILVARPMETTIATPVGFPHAIQITNTQWALVLADNSTAAALRKFLLYIYNSDANTFTYIGAISYTFATAQTIRGIRIQRTLHTDGTVTVAGTSVTGTGTKFLTRRVNAGSRIGFGSTDPSAITTWYDIAPSTAITSDTALTLTAAGPTLASATAYVIEDYALIIESTSATTTNGGLFIIKGLSLSTACWSPTATATVISTATTVDNIRAAYWLKDASTITNLIGAGLCLGDPSADNLTQLCYVLDATSGTTVTIFVFNIKKALTLTSGVDLTAFQYKTGAVTITGTTSQIHNCRQGTLNHGAGSGVACLYFTTTTKLYRCPLSQITTGSTSFLADSMNEVPPGSTNTLPATGAMSNLELFGSIDRIAWFSSGASGARSYVTQYRTDNSQLDYVWLSDQKVQHQAASDTSAYPYPSTDSTVMSSWGENGICFLVRQGTTAALNQIYTIPGGCQWTLQTFGPYNVWVTPSIATPGNTKFYRAYVNRAEILGGNNLGVTPEGFLLYYRTSGITDNSGAWTLLPSPYDLSGVAAAAAIQFKFEFRVLSPTCVPARIFGLAVVYDSGTSIPAQFRWNMDDSVESNATMGFIAIATYGSGVPALTINYYRSDTNAVVLSQSSADSGNTSGYFQYWNGSAWVTGLGPDVAGTRHQFVPTAGLPNGVQIYATLSN